MREFDMRLSGCGCTCHIVGITENTRRTGVRFNVRPRCIHCTRVIEGLSVPPKSFREGIAFDGANHIVSGVVEAGAVEDVSLNKLSERCANQLDNNRGGNIIPVVVVLPSTISLMSRL